MWKLILSVAITSLLFVGQSSLAAKNIEEYIDSSDLQWVNKVSKSGVNSHLNYSQAVKLCRKLSARLPSVEEFQVLAKDLGQGSSNGYSPYVSGTENEFFTGLSQNWYWSSTSGSNVLNYVRMIFTGSNGFIDSEDTHYSGSVLCVKE